VLSNLVIVVCNIVKDVFVPVYGCACLDHACLERLLLRLLDKGNGVVALVNVFIINRLVLDSVLVLLIWLKSLFVWCVVSMLRALVLCFSSALLDFPFVLAS
jgi:hypothetical protein